MSELQTLLLIYRDTCRDVDWWSSEKSTDFEQCLKAEQQARQAIVDFVNRLAQGQFILGLTDPRTR